MYVPSLGGSLQPSTNASNPTPVWIVSPTPPVSSPTLVPSIPTVSSSPPGFEPQPPPTVYPSLPVSPPYSPFQPQAAPIVPIVKMQSYPLTTPFIPTRPPPLVPIPASGLIPLTHTSLPPTPHTTPRNPFEEPDTTSVPTASEEQFFKSSEVPSLNPMDYPEDYTDKEKDGTVVPHYGVPPTTVQPVGSQAVSSIYPIFVGQTHSPPSAIQPMQPVQKPIFRPISVPLPYPPTAGQPISGTISTELTQQPLDQFPYAPTMFPDRQPTPISAATPAPSPPYPQPSPYRPFSVIPFAVTGVAGPTPSSSVITQSGPYQQPTQQQNRPPWQPQGTIAGPPLVAIHPISPLTQPAGIPPVHPSPIAGQGRVPYPGNQTPGPYQPIGPIPGPYQPGGPVHGGPYYPGGQIPGGLTPTPYPPGVYRPSFGTPYPFTPHGAVSPIVPSHPTWPPATAPPTVTIPVTEPTTETTTSLPTTSTTEQVSIDEF